MVRNILLDTVVSMIKGFPGVLSNNAVRVQTHDPLERYDGLSGAAAENAVLIRAGNIRIVFGNDIQQVLKRDDILPAGTLTQYGRRRYRTDPKRIAFAV